MNLQVIISGDGWVLDKHGKILADAFGGELRTQPEPMTSDGITYLMNYAQCAKLDKGPHVGKVVSMLTHYEPSLCRLWDNAAMYSDALVPMSESTLAEIDGYRHKATVIPLPAPDYITKRRPVIGIAACRNVANEHRKGWDLVDRLRAMHPEWYIDATGGTMSERNMLDWYKHLDLYLCPSRYEGGPMGVLEASALGVHCVVPKGVGWCDSVSNATRFTPNDYRSMEAAITKAVSRNQVFTVEHYIEAHRKLFESLK